MPAGHNTASTWIKDMEIHCEDRHEERVIRCYNIGKKESKKESANLPNTWKCLCI